MTWSTDCDAAADSSFRASARPLCPPSRLPFWLPPLAAWSRRLLPPPRRVRHGCCAKLRVVAVRRARPGRGGQPAQRAIGCRSSATLFDASATSATRSVRPGPWAHAHRLMGRRARGNLSTPPALAVRPQAPPQMCRSFFHRWSFSFQGEASCQWIGPRIPMKVHRPGVVLHLVKVFCEANLRRKLQGLGVWKGRGV